MLKLLVFLSAFSGIYLNRFGLQITSDFSLSLSYILIYAAVGYCLLKGYLILDFFFFLFFLILAFSASISFLFGTSERSLTSLFLFLFIYFPFVFKPFSKSRDFSHLFTIFYSPLLIVLAFLGILQFFTQFLFNPPWLFDYRPLIPSFLQNKNPMNTVIPIGGFFKSNGFVLLEPSIFSQWMAFGVALSLFYKNGVFYFLYFMTGLFVSFSGTGVIMTLICLTYSLFVKPKGAFYIYVLGILFLFSFFFSPIGRLAFERVSEFSSGTKMETSSAAARFTNPPVVVSELYSSSFLRFLFGAGSGSMTRSRGDFDFHDPAYAKSLYEYGLLGFTFLIFFIYFSVKDFFDNKLIAALFVVQWLFLGGHLLNFDCIAPYLIYFKLLSVLHFGKK